MKPVRAVIADDEEQLRLYLKKKLLEIWPDLEICGEAENGKQALNLIELEKPDIAFLDIKMPGLTGMEVAGRISGKCRIVFITAYEQYAVDAFESQAVDYLLKPVTADRLKKTVERLKEQQKDSMETSKEIKAAVEEVLGRFKKERPAEHLKWIKAQHRDNIRLIPVDEVIYFKSSSKYTTVITKEGESLIKKPIKELDDELDPEKFWRIHRGTIVNVSCIDKVSHSLTGRFAVKLKNISEILTVSRSYSHLFKQM